MRSLNLFLAVVGSLFFGSSAQAYILIDDFTVGEYHTSITGTGNRDNLSINLDKAHCFAGERGTNYTVSNNPFGYTTFFDIAGHQAKVTTPGPEDLSTQLTVSYGQLHQMNLDISGEIGSLPGGRGKLFEIDLGMTPPNLFARVWSVYMIDGAGRVNSNETFGTRIGGIQFNREGFFGDADFNWSDIDYFIFRQNWSNGDTSPLTYWTSEIRVVPEPSVMTAVIFGAFILSRSRCKRLRE